MEPKGAFIEQPCVWTPMDLRRAPERWHHTFSQDEVDQIDTALGVIESKRALGLDVSTGIFPLGSLRGELLRIREALENDLGLYMLHGLPVERYSDQQLRLIFLGLGRHLGTTLPQSTEGEHLQDVIDRGEPLFGESGRGTNSRDTLPWHTDRCDVVSLLCIRKAPTGGESRVASMANMYNLLRRERPDLLELLCQPSAIPSRIG